MRLSFLWWNTSLSPIGKHRATPKQQMYAQEMVNFFINDLSADLIALGEVKENDISDFSQIARKSNYGVFNGFTKVGRSNFDTCVLFKRDKFELLNKIDIIRQEGKRISKIAQRLDFMIADQVVPLHILVSHWPSRRDAPQDHQNRLKSGMKLRQIVDALYDQYQDKMSLILMGDYNDEPFDRPLSDFLLATRDRELCQQKSHLLYNPFWRRLGYSKPYTYGKNSEDNSGGTYFYKKDNICRWRTFDQIIFSSSFLGSSNWHLNEQSTQILELPGYKKLVLSTKEIFDHLPIIAVLDKVIKHG